MPKREGDSPDLWEAEEAAETEEATTSSSSEFGHAQLPGGRPGFHLQAARKIEEARERRALRKAIEDFDDYDV